ncbi:hypothetical protein Tco_1088661 [Tanacetum coccineum]
MMWWLPRWGGDGSGDDEVAVVVELGRDGNRDDEGGVVMFVGTRMYRDLSLRTSGPLQDPTTATITTITITNGDGMWRVMIFQETISPV